MKRFIAILVLLSVTICLCSCDYRGIYDEAYEDGYEDGHYAGQCDGYYDGIERAKEYIAFVVDDDLSSLAWDIEAEYGLHPEDALQILSNYADVPDEVDEEELKDAIWAIYRYYYDSHKVINDIEDYWID
jgi:hypothetical protein